MKVGSLASLLAVLLVAHAASAQQPAPDIQATPRHELTVRIDPAQRHIEGRDVISIDSASAAPRGLRLLLSSRLHIASLTLDGVRATPSLQPGRQLQRLSLPPARRIEIEWSGTLAAVERGGDHRATLGANEPATDVEGTYLPAGSGWYPMVEGALERYQVTLDLPAGQVGMVPGRLLEESTPAEAARDGRYRARFEFDQAAEGITLVAGPYVVEERQIRTAAGSPVRLRTYFHAAIATLAPGYLDSVAGYLDLYEKRIGAYPFSAFSVVSSPTPTGFGMPTMTYLGVDVLRLPFIRSTSLGHEVLHNWWGNGVYPDYGRGNWSEGLTTFMADYAYKEATGADAARAARLAWLRDVAAMPPADDRPLRAFSSRTHGASQIVGYHKSAMVFFMLRDAIGEAAFEQGLRRFWQDQRFRHAGWETLRKAFEQASGRNLGAFFAQWVDHAGTPDLRIASAGVKRDGPKWNVTVALRQGAGDGKGPPRGWQLGVPLVIRTASGEVPVSMDISAATATRQFMVDAEPLAVQLDPQLRLYRRLSAQEAPPILRQAMLSRSPRLAIAEADAAFNRAARELAEALFERTPQQVQGAASLARGETIVMGTPAGIDAWLAEARLPPRPHQVAATAGTAQVWTIDAGPRGMVVAVSAQDAAALAALARPLPHYGQQSHITFNGERAAQFGIWPSQPQEWLLQRASQIQPVKSGPSRIPR